MLRLVDLIGLSRLRLTSRQLRSEASSVFNHRVDSQLTRFGLTSVDTFQKLRACDGFVSGSIVVAILLSEEFTFFPDNLDYFVGTGGYASLVTFVSHLAGYTLDRVVTLDTIDVDSDACSGLTVLPPLVKACHHYVHSEAHTKIRVYETIPTQAITILPQFHSTLVEGAGHSRT